MRTSTARLLVILLLASCSDDSQPAPATPDGPLPACGNEAVAATVPACRATTSETACRAAGGSWQTVGLARAATYTCVCPTGQLGCACSAAASCAGLCAAEPLNGASGPTCDGVKGLRCSGVVPLSTCSCVADTSGKIAIKCP